MCIVSVIENNVLFLNDTETTELYTNVHTLSRPNALPISAPAAARLRNAAASASRNEQADTHPTGGQPMSIKTRNLSLSMPERRAFFSAAKRYGATTALVALGANSLFSEAALAQTAAEEKERQASAKR